MRVDVLLQGLRQEWRGYGERWEMLEEACSRAVDGQVSDRQLLDVVAAAGEFDAGQFALRYWDGIVRVGGERKLWRSPEFLLVLSRCAKTAGGERWWELFDHAWLAEVFRSGWERWESNAVVKVIQLAGGAGHWTETDEFGRYFFGMLVRGRELLDELAPEEVVELMRIALELGETRWLEEMWRESGEWVEEGGGGFRAMELVERLREFATEYGQENIFGRYFGRVEEDMRGRPRDASDIMRLLRSGPVGGRVRWSAREMAVLAEMFEYGGHYLDELPAREMINLLRTDQELARRVAGRVPRTQWGRWIERLGGGVKERLFLTLGLARSMEDFGVFSKHFVVIKIEAGDMDNRWRIVLSRPRATITLVVAKSSVRRVQDVHWMLVELGKDGWARRLEEESGVSRLRGSREDERRVGRKLWSWRRWI